MIVMKLGLGTLVRKTFSDGQIVPKICPLVKNEDL